MRMNLDQLIDYLQDYEHRTMSESGILSLALVVKAQRETIKKLEADIAELKGGMSQLQIHMSHQFEHRHHIHSEQGGTLGPIYPKKEPEEEK